MASGSVVVVAVIGSVSHYIGAESLRRVGFVYRLGGAGDSVWTLLVDSTVRS